MHERVVGWDPAETNDSERSAPDAPRLAPRGDASEAAPSGHAVQFYEVDAFLVDSVSRFVGAGLAAGDGGVLIATRPHLHRIEQRLSARGVDIASARDHGRYLCLDAAETLSRVMVDGWPEESRFADLIGGVVARAAGGRRLPVRVFGEMVALLVAQGRQRAAIRLEELWNGLAGTARFSLLCGYPMSHFARAADATSLVEVCAGHSRILPAESYAELPTADERLAHIARLQQKAHALEAEVARRKEIEERLARREEELSDFLENALEGLQRIGPDGTILWANAAEMDLLGYAPEEYVGHHVAEFHVDGEVIHDVLERLLRGETVRDQPARLRCKDGAIKHVLIHANALRDDGQFVHTRCATRDVTERVHTERRLAELLAREQAARAEVERLARGKDEFLATLSHELRTPLTAMLGWVRLLRGGQLDGANSAYAIEVIERNTHAQARLIEDLLDVSRIVRDHLRLNIGRVSLVDVIHCGMEAVRPAAEAKGISLDETLDPAVGRVAGDPDRLKQVVWNLVSNAVKYTPAGGRIEVGLCRVGAAAELTVRDTGIGIRAEFLPRLFQRFSQADAGPSRARGGLGLGLAITRHLVELHGGSVEAESPGEGGGATFTVRLPIPIEEAPNGASSGPLSER